MTDDLEFRIARIDLRPGDTLVLKYPRPLSQEQRRNLMEAMKSASGGHRVMVLDGGLDLAVLTAAEIAERTSAPQQDEDAA